MTADAPPDSSPDDLPAALLDALPAVHPPLPGTTRVFTEEWATPCGEGGFLDAYGERWTAYRAGTPDTAAKHGRILDDGTRAFGVGAYDPAIVSVAGGVLTKRPRVEDGRVLGAALVPRLPGGGLAHGVLTFCSWGEVDAGMKVAWMLWALTGWRDGEFDLWEGSLAPGSTPASFVHDVSGTPKVNRLAVRHPTPVSRPTVWRAVWHPTSVAVHRDGVEVARSDDPRAVASRPAKVVLQTETTLDPTWRPGPGGVTGAVRCAWLTVDTWDDAGR